MTGLLAGIARRAKSRAPMEEVSSGVVTVQAGLEGDCKGQKFLLRQITILQRDLWEEALFSLGNPPLSWTVRRANFLVDGIQLPRGIGSEIAVGPVRLAVTAQTLPCAQMDQAFLGLRRALAPDWRGGVTCKVLAGDGIRTGDSVSVIREISQRMVHLPG